jgi:hypothetical protein
VNLGIAERIRLMGMLQNYNGSLIEVKVVKDLLDELGFSEEEIEEKGIRASGDRVAWDDRAEPKDIPMGNAAMGIIRDILKERDEKKQLTVVDVDLCDLFLKEE